MFWFFLLYVWIIKEKYFLYPLLSIEIPPIRGGRICEWADYEF